jgi:hypothetical protein
LAQKLQIPLSFVFDHGPPSRDSISRHINLLVFSAGLEQQIANDFPCVRDTRGSAMRAVYCDDWVLSECSEYIPSKHTLVNFEHTQIHPHFREFDFPIRRVLINDYQDGRRMGGEKGNQAFQADSLRAVPE